MRIKKMVLPLVVAFFAIFTIHNVSASVTFKDVPTSSSLYKEIYYLVNQGVINGYLENGASYYKPANSVTRAEVAKMIVVATGNSPKNITKSTYSDVTVMAGYVDRAVELGFMSPTSTGKFSPNVAITRDEMSKVLAIAFKLDVNATASLSVPFTDVSSSNSYYKYISALYYNGITVGVSTTKYGLTEKVRRDSFAGFVARSMSSSYQLALPIKGVTTPSESDAVGRAYVTTDNLNVRATANASGSILGKVNTGAKLNIYGLENGWVKVDYNGRYAYVSASYIKYIDTDGMTFTLTSSTSATLASDAVVYRGKSNQTKAITTLKAGKTIKIYGTSGEWSITDYGGIPGYILTSTLKGTTTDKNTGTSPNTGSNTSPNTDTSVTTVGKVTVDGLNIRATASATGKIVGTLKTGNVVDVLSISGWWAKVNYKGTIGYVHKTYLHLMNKTGSSVKNRIIVLDPGHGGTDAGAVNGKVYEKNIVLDVAKRVKALLEKSGAKVVLTRSTDTFISLADRPKIATNNYADMFISIHTNSATNNTALGTETFYNSSLATNLAQEKTLATIINNEIVDNANMKDRGIKYGNYAVTRPLEMPAILVELGFISNKNDLAKLTNDQYLQIFAESIYNGIIQYYTYK